ncbi:thylakoid lumenal 29 kDa protein, chloroplastic isoform X1 [Selaginella moellendorffii]|uniref:thylakoid lumenal 29 kDa protein, chloroplastic isoform X1 n=2 Tax=Selaginella moellendorffii TaxID=88036 RepID=UPI000D1CA6DF|nr:thylakoid lumenal 29 kDa protein, chloroplastic isoform X1 [Selaginella moellendorffii]|eukprot:XP_024520798.1 thylakoid lumenal 29 kDa protein, chloroplastic isoform X1 [Selaginella moellendorffii]
MASRGSTFVSSAISMDSTLRGVSSLSHRTRCSSSRQVVSSTCQLSDKFHIHVSRREALVGLSSTSLAFGSWNGIASTDNAMAADLIQRSQRADFLGKIKVKLAKAIKENPELVPFLLRLALNDAITYDKETKTGGPNGSIRLSEELKRPENVKLDSAVTFLEGLKKEIDEESKGGPISWADLIQIGGQAAAKRTFLDAAIKKCGGNEEKGNFLYNAYGSNGQWGFFDKQFGRSDKPEPDPEGRVLLWEEAPIAEITNRFSKVGLGPRQVAVLSAFLGTDQAAMDAKLAQDSELARWVKKYQDSRETVSQTDYEVDLIGAFTRLSILGQSINYEAYTYPPKKFKLKL